MAVCDICGHEVSSVTPDGKDQLTVVLFHKLIKHQEEIIKDDPVIQQSNSSKQVRYWDKKKDGWVTVTPMDNFSYDLQPTGKARKVSKSEEMIYGNAGLIKKDGIDE